jgi:hypothetical protein
MALLRLVSESGEVTHDKRLKRHLAWYARGILRRAAAIPGRAGARFMAPEHRLVHPRFGLMLATRIGGTHGFSAQPTPRRATCTSSR